MEKQIILQNKKITYSLCKSKRARRMRLTVYCDGAVVVTAPFDLNENAVEMFVRNKTEWLISKINYFRQFKYKRVEQCNWRDLPDYKKQAFCLVRERIARFGAVAGYQYNKVNIKNQKTRWGSCSKKGNLNFNYKIIFLDEKLRDYIIAHELCHLREFNHSEKFWNLVARIIPDYQKIRKELKRHILDL